MIASVVYVCNICYLELSRGVLISTGLLGHTYKYCQTICYIWTLTYEITCILHDYELQQVHVY